jgi:hypothetical protein
MGADPLTLEEVGIRAADVVAEGLRQLLEGLPEEASHRLDVLASDLALHWRLVAQGRQEEADANLDCLRAEALCLVAQAGIHGGEALEHAFVTGAELLAKMGGILLRGLII